ncbi:MAG: hypothetical protein J1G06_08585 [Oscillospiraceae bacterium]|nr:hypothetical protein [Oscillospiraceae bacterium]
MIETQFKKIDMPRVMVWTAQAFPQLKDNREYVITIKERKKPRSRNANAYAWVLIDKLAEFYGLEPEYIYKQALQNIGGVSVDISVLPKAVDDTIRVWESRGMGWQCERIGEYDGGVDLKCIYGSSVFNTRQMSQLIDGIVNECKQVGIETMTPDELARLKAAWGDYVEKGR